MAVLDSYRNKGIGKKLYDAIINYASQKGIKNMFILTSTAEKYFKKLGFQNINRKEVPDLIKKTAEFTSLCPLSAVCMVKNIDKEPKYFTKKMLNLKKNISGSKMWAVALKRCMLTYFELEPGCSFEAHTHNSEQITLVLKGELIFEFSGKVFYVKSGEVMAIPSNVRHSVKTKDSYVKAIDAWSPVMNKYL